MEIIIFGCIVILAIPFIIPTNYKAKDAEVAKELEENNS